MEDARGLFRQESPVVKVLCNMKREVCDIEEFSSWESLGEKVRLVI